MKNGIGTNPAYRRVVAALEDCEERYGGLIKSIGGTIDSHLASTVATLRQIQFRRRGHRTHHTQSDFCDPSSTSLVLGKASLTVSRLRIETEIMWVTINSR